ncbi:RNA polymerase-associated protein RapA [compost metagenome]
MPRSSANKFVQAQRDALAKQFAIGESKVLPRHAERVEKARQHLVASLDEELARLTALKEVNPSVRDSELEALRKQRDQSLELLDKASLRLEAIRILVAG